MDLGDVASVISALIAFFALFISIISSRSTKKYAEKEISLIKEQFKAEVHPDIEAKAFLTRKSETEEELILVCEISNHSNTIPITDLKSFLIINDVHGSGEKGFMFFVKPELKPGEKIRIEAAQQFENYRLEFFPDADIYIIEPRGGVFDSQDKYSSHRATFHISYMPRFVGAKIVEEQLPYSLCLK